MDGSINHLSAISVLRVKQWRSRKPSNKGPSESTGVSHRNTVSVRIFDDLSVRFDNDAMNKNWRMANAEVSRSDVNAMLGIHK